MAPELGIVGLNSFRGDMAPSSLNSFRGGMARTPGWGHVTYAGVGACHIRRGGGTPHTPGWWHVKTRKEVALLAKKHITCGIFKKVRILKSTQGGSPAR